MFLGKLIILTTGITIISLSQFFFLSNFQFDVAASSVSDLLSGFNSDDKLELLPDTQTIIVNQVCDQYWTIDCQPLLSMSSGRPISEINSPMKIKFRQSGGYAGLTKGCEINTELLSAEEAQELKSLVDQSGILEAESKKSPNVADAFNYNLVIETIKKTYRLSFDEQSLPEEVIPLIDFLEDCSDYIRRN